MLTRHSIAAVLAQRSFGSDVVERAGKWRVFQRRICCTSRFVLVQEDFSIPHEDTHTLRPEINGNEMMAILTHTRMLMVKSKRLTLEWEVLFYGRHC